MANDRLVSFEELSTITGYQKPSDVERCLVEQGIQVFRGRRGRLWTTMDLVNHAGGLRQAADNDDAYSPDIL